MKSPNIPRVLLSLALTSFSTAAVAQSHDHGATTATEQARASAPKSEAQISFDVLKTLAGKWEGPVNVPEVPAMSNGKPIHLSLRVNSRGHTLVHELQEGGTPLDPAKYDHPVSMLYLDGDQLTLVHYCDAGNRPRMTGKMSADGKSVEFDFLDISGNALYHMHHAVFTLVDANHHTEDWTFMMKDKPIHAHFDLERSKSTATELW
jgi:hypothetical protein